MSSFETTATVEYNGQIRLAGVPFAAGTEVEVTISPTERSKSKQTRAPDLPDAGLRWAGNVLVHQGTGVDTTVAGMRDERLKHL